MGTEIKALQRSEQPGPQLPWDTLGQVQLAAAHKVTDSQPSLEIG